VKGADLHGAPDRVRPHTDLIAPLARLPHVMFFGSGVVIKLGDEVIGSIDAARAAGTKLDDRCAHAGLDKIHARLKWTLRSPVTENVPIPCPTSPREFGKSLKLRRIIVGTLGHVPDEGV
jgi:hypothetical protein